jgi:hypothetical protein
MRAAKAAGGLPLTACREGLSPPDLGRDVTGHGIASTPLAFQISAAVASSASAPRRNHQLCAFRRQRCAQPFPNLLESSRVHRWRD